MKKAFELVKETFKQWSEDKAPRLAAALAYYTAFSIAPILVIAIALVGLFYDRANAQGMIEQQVGGLAGAQGQELITSMLEASSSLGGNVLATIVGVVALLFGATGVFVQLQDAMNTMWEVKPKPNRGIMGIIKDRFFSLGMVVGVGFLLLVTLLVSAALSALGEWSAGLFPGFETVMQVVNFVVSLLVITVLFALVFKFVPDADIAWKDVWLGAFVTAVLFTIGKTIIGIYLGNGSVTEQFGAAGALVVLLIWVYYSAQISFFGAEFTQVYANRYGSKVVPEEHAERVTEGERAEQGIPHREEAPGKKRDRAEPAGGVFQPIPMTGSESAISPIEGQEMIQGRDEDRLFMVPMLFTAAASMGLGFLLSKIRR